MNDTNAITTLPALAANIRQHHEAGRRDAIAMAEHWLEAGACLSRPRRESRMAAGPAGWKPMSVSATARRSVTFSYSSRASKPPPWRIWVCAPRRSRWRPQCPATAGSNAGWDGSPILATLPDDDGEQDWFRRR